MNKPHGTNNGRDPSCGRSSRITPLAGSSTVTATTIVLMARPVKMGAGDEACDQTEESLSRDFVW
jgi:hypothetical protein